MCSKLLCEIIITATNIFGAGIFVFLTEFDYCFLKFIGFYLIKILRSFDVISLDFRNVFVGNDSLDIDIASIPILVSKVNFRNHRITIDLTTNLQIVFIKNEIYIY